MPIKSIELRGLSRAPSDRLTEDGGCAESLNVHLDTKETAPTLPPVDITDAIGHEPSDFGRVVFIHKTSLAEIPIIYWAEGTSRYIKYAAGGEEYTAISLFDYEDVTTYASIGNTLVVTTNMHNHYLLYKHENAVGSRYVNLGTKIPEPRLEFMTVTEPSDGVYTTQAYRGGDGKRDLVHQLDETTWNKLINGTTDESDNNWATLRSEYNDIVGNIWTSINKMLVENRQKGYFCTPVLVRYALRLYDGSYIYQSAPALMGANGCAFFSINRSAGAYEYSMTYYGSGVSVGGETGLIVDTSFASKSVYSLCVKLAETYDIGGWSDIIQSIDIFISKDIYLPPLNSKFTSLATTTESTPPRRFGTLSIEATSKTFEEDEVTKASVFYKVASYAIEDLSELENETAIKPYSQDELFVQQTLQDDQWSFHENMALNEMSTYNNRLLMGGVKTLLYPGPGVFQSLLRDNDSSHIHRLDPDVDYFFIFHIKDANGDTYKVKTQMLSPTIADWPYPMRWICYPDTRCFKAEFIYLKNGVYQIHEFPMKEHPNLNCSYHFWGFGTNLFSLVPERTSQTNPASSIDNEDAVIVDRKMIMLSEFENPFLFPIANRRSMSGDIIGIASTTMPLAAYQTGRFQQYVFTTDGVFSIDVNQDGTLGASSAHNREVAIAGTILPTEMSIIFATRKGVMLMTESECREISQYMIGRHYILDEVVQDALEDTGWEDLVPSMTDEYNFMAFIEGSTPVYDYPGRRIIFFGTGVHYAYVYMLESATWHKIFLDGFVFLNRLNSFPNAYCSVLTDDSSPLRKVYDFTTYHDVQGTDNIIGAIVTRPLDLDNPNVRKSIRSIRIRGNYNVGDVKYILLGSMDGLDWQMLRSLHSGSWKQYRIVLLTNLAPDERISWIDVDYDTRFTNKLR